MKVNAKNKEAGFPSYYPYYTYFMFISMYCTNNTCCNYITDA